MASIYEYISKTLGAPLAAQRQYDSIAEAIESLSSFPKRFAAMESKLEKLVGIRKLAVGNYVALYRVNTETRTVEVVRVLYARCDIDTLLSQCD